MRKKKWKSHLHWILLCEGVGLASGLLSRAGMEQYSRNAVQPPFAPPGLLFPIVWTILFALMGCGMALADGCGTPGQNAKIRMSFFSQLAVNFLWPLIFFNAGAYGFALAWLMLLCILVVDMALRFSEENKTAGLLQIPYLLWLSFAAVLNCAVWRLNR